MPNVNVDLILNGQAQGEVAGRFSANGALNLGRMRPFIANDGNTYMDVYKGQGSRLDVNNYITQKLNINGTLRRDEWKALDAAVMQIAEYRLGGVQDLTARGLIYPLGNAMGTTVLEWHDVSDALTAEMTMDGVTRAKNDRPVFQHNYLPIPIIHADYEINTRALATSRNMGNGIDVTLAERAARRVSEKLENMFFTNTTYGWGEKDSRTRNSIYSYVNFPDRNAYSLSHPWDGSGATGATILADVLGMKQKSIDDYFYGPWQLYIPTGYETILDEDYFGSNPDSNPNVTVRDRILKIAGITGIKVVDTLAADNVLMVQMTSDVVRLVHGMGLQNVEWMTEGNFIHKYKVMTIQVPQIRSDQDGHCGIVHAT